MRVLLCLLVPGGIPSPWVIWIQKDLPPFLNSAWQRLLPLWAIWPRSEFTSFICKPAIWTSISQDCLSSTVPAVRPHTTVTALMWVSSIRLGAKVTKGMWWDQHCSTQLKTVWLQLGVVLSILEEWLWTLRLQSKVQKLTTTKYPTHPHPPANQQGGQMSANLMEDINDFHSPPAELAVGPKFKGPSSSPF